MRTKRRGVKAPKLFGRPMRKTRGKSFVLRYAGWTFSVIGISVHQWMYSVAAPDDTGGHLLGNASVDSADSAAAVLEQLISSLAIAVVTSNPAAARLAGAPALRSALAGKLYEKAHDPPQGWPTPKHGKSRVRRA